jgi:serine protease inhibitor ecotin
MKEAYTKALGLGLGMEFAGFEIQAEFHVYSYFLQDKDPTVPIACNIYHVKSNTLETWNFHFIALKKDSSPVVIGCACVCSPGSTKENVTLSVSHITLGQLIDYHVLL